MSETLCTKLNAYFDGELDSHSQMEVEAHLATCTACRQELDELRQISQILRAAPLPEFTPVSVFKDQLAAKLPDRAKARAESEHPEKGILPWLAPLLVLAGWIFIQVALNLSTVVSLASQAGVINGAGWAVDGARQMQWFTYAQVAFSGLLSLKVPAGLKMLNDASLFAQAMAVPLLWEFGVAVIYWAALGLVLNRGLFAATE